MASRLPKPVTRKELVALMWANRLACASRLRARAISRKNLSIVTEIAIQEDGARLRTSRIEVSRHLGHEVYRDTQLILYPYK